MSFKREGDDHGWLHNLKKQRVDELLTENIPEDEAKLLKNGRYCCLVCYHRPIFDTINMMSIHRQGKKHEANLERFKTDKDDLEREKLRRMHEGTLKGFAQPSQHSRELSKDGHSLLKAPVYNPQIKRTKVTRHDRKPIINFTHERKSTSTDSTASSSHPGDEEDGNDHIPQTISEYRERKKLELKKKEDIEIKPYIKKSNKYFKNLVAVTSAYRNEQVKGSDSAPQPTPTHSAGTLPVQPQTSDSSRLSVKPSTMNSAIQKKTSLPSSQGEKTIDRKLTHIEKSSGTQAAPDKSAEEKRAQAARYLKAIGSGWKKDRGGNWVKDENAEFDSDEEPPDF